MNLKQLIVEIENMFVLRNENDWILRRSVLKKLNQFKSDCEKLKEEMDKETVVKWINILGEE